MALESHGYRQQKSQDIRGYQGLDLKSAEKGNPYWIGGKTDFD